MRTVRIVVAACAIAAFAQSARAADLTRWFSQATQYQSGVVASKLSAPDFLPGTTTRSACGDSGGTAALERGRVSAITVYIDEAGLF